MTGTTEGMGLTRRRLILRDALSFFSLTVGTLVLLAVTLLLFRSFMSHRATLAQGWAQRGHAALLAHQPERAVGAYRAALSYAPGERASEAMLAQALAEAGHTDEAYSYYMELWTTHPGDGATNLQLARLAARKREVQDAINFYRASLYGTWEGDGVERRLEVRLELARYLIAEHQPGAARAELLIAGGNAPDSPALDLTLARLLEQAAAPSDALAFYREALIGAPDDLVALRGAGRLSLAAGDYATASGLLRRATRLEPDSASLALLAQVDQLLRPHPAPRRKAHYR